MNPNSPPSPGVPPLQAAPELREQVIQWMQTLGDRLPLADLQDLVRRQPQQSVLVLVGAMTVLFYLAERRRNDKVDDLFDSLEYCTSSLSVGYTDIYPQSPIGKLVGSILMLVGPTILAQVAQTMVKCEPPPSDPTQQEILRTLQAILRKLEDQDAKSESRGTDENPNSADAVAQ